MTVAPKELTPEQAVPLVGRSLATLRRWRSENKGPPFVFDGGGKPKYRSDLLSLSSTPLRGEQAAFPPLTVPVPDTALVAVQDPREPVVAELIEAIHYVARTMGAGISGHFLGRPVAVGPLVRKCVYAIEKLAEPGGRSHMAEIEAQIEQAVSGATNSQIEEVRHAFRRLGVPDCQAKPGLDEASPA